MAEVTVSVNGRAYRFDCGDGEEPRLRHLAAYLEGRVNALTREHGNAGDERLLVMAALLMADDLLDARAELEEASNAGDRADNAEAKRRA